MNSAGNQILLKYSQLRKYSIALSTLTYPVHCFQLFVNRITVCLR